MSDFQTRSLITRAHQQMQLTPIYAIVGDGNSPSTIFDPTIPGNVYVRIQYANGYGRAISVRGPVGTSVQLVPNARVELVYTADRRLQIKNYDIQASIVAGTNILAQNIPQPPSSNFVGQQSLVTALVTPQTVPDMTVVVKSWNIVTGGLYAPFHGSGTLDLTSFVPSSGNQCYAGVFIQDDYTTLVVKASTPRSTLSVDLGDADVQECISAAPINSVVLAIIRLYSGQTKITNDDFKKDLRQIVNTDPGEYTATVSTTDATVTSLMTLTIPASTTVAIHGYVTARRTGGSSGTAEDGAYYERAVAIKNVAGTATIVGSVASIATMEDQAGWDCTFDVTGATVRCRITGAASNNVNWKGTFKVVKVS